MTKTGGTGKNLKSGKGSISVNKNVILLIEDEEKLSRTLAEYLELNGYRGRITITVSMWKKSGNKKGRVLCV